MDKKIKTTAGLPDKVTHPNFYITCVDQPHSYTGSQLALVCSLPNNICFYSTHYITAQMGHSIVAIHKRTEVLQSIMQFHMSGRTMVAFFQLLGNNLSKLYFVISVLNKLSCSVLHNMAPLAKNHVIFCR